MLRTPTLAPPPADAAVGGGDDLYRLYERAMAGLARRVRAERPAGPDRDRTLAGCRPLPKEHFEANLERLAATPGAVAGYVAELRRLA